MGIYLLKSLLYGILEGVTEWLPVSSTGHLILLEDLLALHVGTDVHPQFAAEFSEFFLVAIQLGAILAVVTTYAKRLSPAGQSREKKKLAISLWSRALVGCIPAGLAGIVLDELLVKLTGKDMDGLLYTPVVVACMLILYGVLFIVVERVQRGKTPRVTDLEQMPYTTALGVGAFQMLSLIPGTSRSGATILGGMLLGLSRKAAAEFSFFMAVPVMLGASGLKALGFGKFLLQNGLRMPYEAALVLLVAGATAYVTSRLAIRFLMDFSARHGFAPFGIYRILLGTAVLLMSLL
ncbi:MAG: undecaprenyl-diphosphate phosphatase [Ruminococcaceae bacterium]|nr:undecaprenyl-diphosphate phosphatase [Oscillospiraceae bacterium]